MKIKNIIILQVLVLLSPQCLAQNQANTWFWANDIGLDFNHSPPAVITGSRLSRFSSNGTPNSLEGGSCYSDENGQLVLYTDGITLFNSDHDTLIDGSGLNGSRTAVQSSMIIKTNQDNRYMVITLDDYGTIGLHYSIVDMSVDPGKVISKNTLINADIRSERMAAYTHPSGDCTWLATASKTELLIYKVTATNVTLHKKYPIAFEQSFTPRGQIKFSNSGRFLVFSSHYRLNTVLPNGDGYYIDGALGVYKFDVETGVIKDQKQISGTSSIGLEISPNEKYFYVMNWNKNDSGESCVTQIPNPYLADSLNPPVEVYCIPTLGLGAMQMGPDGKIYFISCLSIDSTISYIDKPNEEGLACDVRDDAIKLSDRVGSSGVIPSFVQDYISPFYLESDTTCENDDMLFTLINNYSDSAFLLLSNGSRQRILNDSLVLYNVQQADSQVVLQLFYPAFVDTVEYDFNVLANPTANLGPDSLICNDEQITFDFSNRSLDSLIWFDGEKVLSRTFDSTVIASVQVFKDGCSAHDTARIYQINCDILGDSFCVDQEKELRIADSSVDSTWWSISSQTIRSGNILSWTFDSTGSYEVDATVFLSGLSKDLSTSVEVKDVLDDVIKDSLEGCKPFEFHAETPAYYSLIWEDQSVNAIRTLSNSQWVYLSYANDYCSAKDSSFIKVRVCNCEVYISSAFTPNGDSHNDDFGVETSDCEMTSISLRVFNRWGQKVFGLESSNPRWDGTFRGTPCQDGSYVYLVDYTDSNGDLVQLKGQVLLIR